MLVVNNYTTAIVQITREIRRELEVYRKLPSERKIESVELKTVERKCMRQPQNLTLEKIYIFEKMETRMSQIS